MLSLHTLSMFFYQHSQEVILSLTPGFHVCVHAQSLSLCDPMDGSPPGFSVHGISQARMLEWVAISSPRRSSLPRDQTCISCVSCIGRWILCYWAIWGAWFPHIHTKASGNKCWLDFTFFRISGVTGGSCHLLFPLFLSHLYCPFSISLSLFPKDGGKKREKSNLHFKPHQLSSLPKTWDPGNIYLCTFTKPFPPTKECFSL